MREIKFRAWDGKKMQYDVFPTSDNTVGRWIETGGGVELRFCDGGGTKVDIMQFSGLKDKNGKEIYEGDCFRTSDKHGFSSDCIAEVLFEDGAFAIQLYRNDDMEIAPELILDFKRSFQDSFVIIGNKAQHPKLLEQDNDPENPR